MEAHGSIVLSVEFNKGRTFTMNAGALDNIEEQRDLDAHVCRFIMVAAQVDGMMMKAYRMLNSAWA